MKSGDIILASLPQADGKTKLRPALVLKQMLPYKDLLVCGISTQINQEVLGFDEIINANDIDFIESGLIQKSLPLGICNPEPIRYGFLIRFTL
jgi:mRNA interferase MazF